MSYSSVIGQIDERIASGEYNDFKLTANRLTNIRGKLLHRKKLSKNDIKTLKEEDFFIG